MDHKEMNVWLKSMDLVETIYRLSGNFPKEEIYGLTSQIQRAAVSIPSNIAEGAARKGDKEFVQFISIALGSLS
jgi:four helix bundle protein